MLLFQSSSWKSGKKQKEQKQVSDVFKTECEASKQDRPQGFWKEKARAKIECSELRFDVKKLTRMWKHKPAKKKKASFDVYQVGCGENKLDRMPKDLERAKSKF